jgi:hypothetical protein
MLDSYLDILKIVRLEEEFEKLKFILLSKEQLSMFNFMSKDLYSLEEKEEQNCEVKKLKNLFKDKGGMINFIISYLNGLDATNLTMHDKRLLQLLDSDIKKALGLTDENLKFN